MSAKKLMLLILGLAMVLVSCGAEKPAETDTGTEGAEARKPVNIYAVSHGACAWDSYWCVVERGSDDAASDLGVQVTLLTTDKFDLEATAQNIDRAVAAEPDGLMVTVTDAVLFEEPIMRAIDAGIPVIAYDSFDVRPREERIPYLTAVGPNEYTAGYQAAGRFIAAHGGTRAVCINQQVGHALLDLRCQGFADRLAEDGISSEMLGISDDPAQSATVISDYYTANPDVDLFLTLGPNGADPFYAFMEAEGLKAGDIFHGTFDLSPEIVAKIEDGTTDFAIDGGPYLVGYLPVMWLTMINRYGLYPPDEITATGPSFVDKTNIAVAKELAGTYR